MAKYPILFQKGNELLKRSVSVEQMETLYIVSDRIIVAQTARKTGRITFVFKTGELVSSVVVKTLPLWVLKRFKPQKDWLK